MALRLSIVKLNRLLTHTTGSRDLGKFFKMSSFNGFGLFDPDGQDEDSDSELFLSASELLEKRSRKPPKRSHTDINLKPSSSSGFVPRSNTSLDLKSTLKEGKGLQGLGRSRTFSAPVDDDYTYLPPEPQMGNIEYK